MPGQSAAGGWSQLADLGTKGQGAPQQLECGAMPQQLRPQVQGIQLQSHLLRRRSSSEREMPKAEVMASGVCKVLQDTGMH